MEVKGVLQQTFLFQLTNDLCRSFTKIIIILFVSKALSSFFIKKNFVVSIFCAENRTTIKIPLTVNQNSFDS